jgi:KaiC/GvpD/RAD55 family RecA-like ATPase
MMFERVSTGVKGLDTMLRGGLIKGRTYLIKGGPGSGKTILSMHFLHEGAKRGENVVYVTLEESVDEVVEDMKAFGFDMSKIRILDLSPSGDKTIFSNLLMGLEMDTQALQAILESEFDRLKPSRVVVDSITMLKVASKSELDYRKDVLLLIDLLKRFNTTAVLTSEMSKNGVEDYLVSGVIELHTIDVRGKTLRGIRILKMRGSDFDDVLRPYKITSRGLEVYSDLNLLE